MKNFLLIVVLATLFACGGGGDKHTPLEDSLANANQNISNELKDKEVLLKTKEESITEFLNSFNEIQANLTEIKAKEKILSVSSESKDIKKANKEQILADLQSIYDLLNKNQAKVASLNKKLKDSNLKIEELNLAISNLTNQLTEKEGEITDLKTKLEKLNMDFADLKVKYVEEQQASEVKTEKLNAAYFVVGTKKDLVEKGIVTSKGGFIGMGKVVTMSESVDGKNFTKIDVSTTKEIAINGKKVKIVSTHAPDSYKLTTDANGLTEKITITNIEKFWSASKYLIITAEK